jgi:hypothetical protein
VRYVDAQDPRKSNWARFINCPGPGDEPNVEVVEEQGELQVWSRRDLRPGEELLWDYGDKYEIPGGPNSSTNESTSREEKYPTPVPSNEITLSPDEDQTLRGLEPDRLRNEIPVAEDQYVLVWDPAFDDDIFVGQVVEAVPDGDGAYVLWVYGIGSVMTRIG